MEVRLRRRPIDMSSAQFYAERAEEARRDASVATLDNVRVNCLRSAEVWQSLADRAARVDAERVVREEAINVRRGRELP
jgi:hypothetical protein